MLAAKQLTRDAIERFITSQDGFEIAFFTADHADIQSRP